MTPIDRTLAFIGGLTWEDVPDSVRERVAWLFLDASVAAEQARGLEAARIAADFASAAYGGSASTCLYDGRKVSAPGAAWANGTLMNALDFDDGHPLAKGHPGAVVIPAALAVAEHVGADLTELVTAVVVGYEVGVRAAVQQHDRWPLFHSTGTWGTVAAAAAAARLLGLDAARTDSALGLAEYHSPTDLIMRAVAAPSMAKDAMGWGAQAGVAAALLAAEGFTAHRSEFLEGRAEDGLGSRWEILDVYVKPFPCCRWAHPALAAARSLLTGLGVPGLRAEDVARIEVRTFEAAAGLSRGVPRTSEEAQFNLPWPIACMLATGGFGLADVTTGLGDPDVAALMSRVEIVVDPALTARFPHVRRSEVTVTLTDGRTVASGETAAAGDADDPGWTSVVLAKLSAADRLRLVSRGLDPEPGSAALGGLGLADLRSALTYPLRGPAAQTPDDKETLHAHA
ncbi:2-methylcitrate dehydratase PrpD [Actinocorallia herbida]|uniref:2-methylcitrate dehydratase PrpD n=1 Tax=Actinocorallia herbida TaxID=58109 RepID=A0A3N1CY98_9ACTN|nr:MmgE/PrpD family protein [Actinocorallia herbida]ROO86251.1 2-methylcitrate dehydratase PrpD [Actinocorallia herbida]